MSQLTQPGADSAGPQQEGTADQRPALTILTGFSPTLTREAADALLNADPALLVVSHDLAGLPSDGRIHRTVRDGTGVLEDARVDLEHGCVSCTLREDVLPTLVRLAHDLPGRDLVLALPPAIEPESLAAVCAWCQVDGKPVTDAIRIDSVIAVCDPHTALDALDSPDDLADRNLHAADDDHRSVADVVARQIEFADTVLVWAPGAGPDFEHARLSVLLQRLNPWAAHLMVDMDEPARISSLLRGSGRFNPDGPDLYGRGLEGYAVGTHEPEADCGVVSMVYRARRPFHPERLHQTLPTLVNQTLRGRGHLWVASQPDHVVAWESGGGGLSMGDLGLWLAATPDQDWDEASPERRVAADLNWDEDFGDRDVHLAFVGIHFDPAELTEALEACQLTDTELAAGRATWGDYTDPFEGCFAGQHSSTDQQ